jgi:hypothetical protein
LLIENQTFGHQQSKIINPQLFNFLMRRVLAATAAEFLEFQPLGRRLPILGRRIVPLFAVTAL